MSEPPGLFANDGNANGGSSSNGRSQKWWHYHIPWLALIITTTAVACLVLLSVYYASRPSSPHVTSQELPTSMTATVRTPSSPSSPSVVAVRSGDSPRPSFSTTTTAPQEESALAAPVNPADATTVTPTSKDSLLSGDNVADQLIADLWTAIKTASSANSGQVLVH